MMTTETRRHGRARGTRSALNLGVLSVCLSFLLPALALEGCSTISLDYLQEGKGAGQGGVEAGARGHVDSSSSGQGGAADAEPAAESAGHGDSASSGQGGAADTEHVGSSPGGQGGAEVLDAGAETGGGANSLSGGQGGTGIPDAGAETGGGANALSGGQGGRDVPDAGAETGGVADSTSGGQGGAVTGTGGRASPPSGGQGGSAGGLGGSSGATSATGGGCSDCAALVHRYSFDGTGQDVVDSVGSAHGVVVNAELSGSGTVALAGGDSDEYVDLPNGIVSSHPSVTLEVWVTWGGGDPWQRVLDFGASTGEEGTQAESAGSIALIPAGPTNLRASYRGDATAPSVIDGAAPLPTGTMSHVALVLDASASLLVLYHDAVEAGQATLTGPASLVNDINNWLGRSQYLQDPDFNGTFHELRIYDGALSASEVLASFEAGPDTVVVGAR